MGIFGQNRYQDRKQSGRSLVPLLQPISGLDPIVVGIPRGGVIVAAEVALGLGAPLDVLVIRKVGAPQNPELAIGAVSAGGQLHLDHLLIERLGIDQQVLTTLISQQQHLARSRADRYGGNQSPDAFTGQTVIVVDDGLATGTTMNLALQLIRQQRPAQLIAAVPVGSRSAVALIGQQADEVICPLAPTDFRAVGEFYENFDEITDEQVESTLASFSNR